MERDPRKDPRPRDVLHKGTRERMVTERKGNDIHYWTRGGASEKICWITTWMDWARTAEVLERGE